MTDIMKQRLVGSLLLLLVIGGAAIFLIGQTDNDDKEIAIPEESGFVSSIEPMPVEFVEVDHETLLDPHQLEQQSSDIEEKLDDVSLLPTAEKEIVKPIVTETLVPVIEEKSIAVEKETVVVEVSSKPSWIIQLGSFSVQANAQALNDKASKLGLNSRVEKSDTNYRVRIGPEYDKQLVDSIAEKISKQLAIKPQVLSQQTESKQ